MRKISARRVWRLASIILQDPTHNCRRRGTLLDWQGLPHDKSLFYSQEGCGLPIGNLTSQLFSNVYLNELDQYVKRTLYCRHYGRYVDDFYVVSADREWLYSLQQPLKAFLLAHLGLEANSGKTRIADVSQGVAFLGAFLKPRRRYVERGTLQRLSAKLRTVEYSCEMPELVRSRLNSMLGLLSHHSSFSLRRELFLPLAPTFTCGYFGSVDISGA